jgi:beta-phosphoglucomutase
MKAVLFDYDGVIADSMGDNYLAWKYVFAKHNVPYSKDVYYPLEGMSPMGIVLELTKKLGFPRSKHTDIAREKDEYYKTHHTRKIFPHVISTITELKKRGLKIALVSGGLYPRIMAATPQEVMDLFDVVVTSDMVTRTKPYPDPYLKALEMLHISAPEAIVVENAPLGIASAKAAGLYCIALSTTVPCSALSEADVCVDDIENVTAIVLSM